MRLSRHFTFAAGLLLAGSLAACVSQQKYDALDNDYNALNLKLSGEIGAQQVHITRLQGAIKIAVDSALLFPSGGWQMSPASQATIAKMAPTLAPFVSTQIVVTGYTDSVPIGPELAARGIASNQVLSQMRADAVMNFLISKGMKPGLVAAKGFGDAEPVAPNDTEEGRAKNRRVELSLYPL